MFQDEPLCGTPLENSVKLSDKITKFLNKSDKLQLVE